MPHGQLLAVSGLKPYQLLNRPRHLMKELQHRSKYRKAS